MDTIDLDRRAASRPETSPRRTKLRLRDLCDEVLASYRAAKGRGPLSDSDRAEAESVLRTVAPLTKR